MKKLAIGLLTLTGVLSAYECYDCPPPPPCFTNCGCGYWYAQLGASALGIGTRTTGGVAFGFGWRYLASCSGVDISLFFQEGDRAYSLHYPRLRYLYYVTPSVYAGGGFSFNAAKTGEKKFRGLATELVVGVDLPTESPLRTFVELALSQPTVKVSSNRHLLGPSLALTFGIGF